MRKVILGIVLVVIIASFSGCVEEKESETKKTTEEIATDFITYLSQEKYNNAYNYFNWRIND